MKLLLDSHTFLWWDAARGKLSPRVLDLCQDQETELLLSLVSVWEIQIKSALGKLSIRLPLNKLLQEQEEVNQIQLLPVTLEHVLALDRLPPHHKDPFDRLLIAQALVEGLTLASTDGPSVRARATSGKALTVKRPAVHGRSVMSEVFLCSAWLGRFPSMTSFYHKVLAVPMILTVGKVGTSLYHVAIGCAVYHTGNATVVL